MSAAAAAAVGVNIGHFATLLHPYSAAAGGGVGFGSNNIVG